MPSQSKIKGQIQYLPLTVIHKHSKNPRLIKDRQFKILTESIHNNPDYFEARPIICSDRTGENVILAGHMRYEAAKKLKLSEVPVFILKGLTEEREREIMIRDNVGNGEWNWDILSVDYDVEQLAEWGLELPDFEVREEVNEDDFNASTNIKTDIKIGDLFHVGVHKLLCGSSSEINDVQRLLDGEKADMIFTDPPYDLEDNYSQNIFDVAKDDCHIFIMNSDRLLIENVNNGYSWFRKFFAVDFRQARLVSNNQPMTRVDLIAEFCKGKTKFNNLYDGFSTLIECSKIHNDNEDVNFGFNQAKRIELPSTFIQHYSNKNELIIDFFGGAGSTMAASEQLGRRCYMMEIDPVNCQIIINRMKEKYNLSVKKIAN